MTSAAGLLCPTCRVSLVMSERSGIEIDYQSTGSSVKTVRVYKSLLETAASIGGVNKIISMVFGLVYALLHYFISKNLLVTGIFNLDSENMSSYLRFIGSCRI